MKESTRNFFVGLTAIAGIVGFIYLVFIFGEVPTWMTESYPLQVSLNHAGGLSEGSRVTLNGVDVGHVANLRLQDDPRDGVILTAQIESRYDIPSDARVMPSAGLLGGGATLAIVAAPEPGVAEAQPLPRDGSGYLTGTAPPDFATLTSQLQTSLDEQLQNFGRMTDKLAELSDQYIEVGQRVSAMLEQRDLADVDAGRVPANITTMLARADARLAELQDTIGEVNEFIGDEQLRDDLRETLANTRLFSEDARRLAQNADRNLDTLMRRFVAVADDLSRTLDSVDSLVAQAQEGEGTLGQLMQNPALYNDLQDAAGRLSDALRDAQLLMEKWRVEGLPVQF